MTDLEKDIKQGILGLGNVAPNRRRDPDAETYEERERELATLLEALRYGAPPHAGIALGLDRWVMMLSGNENIREVIAFPKTQKAADLLSGAPSPVDAKQLRDLRIKVDLPT